VLLEIWHKMNPVARDPAPKEGSDAWTAWIVGELNKPLGFLPNFFRCLRRDREFLDLPLSHPRNPGRTRSRNPSAPSSSR
jgi:hypothetical protein